MMQRLFGLSMVFLIGATVVTGCVYKSTQTERTATPSTTVAVATPNQRVYTYPEGRYELRGQGSSASPYYWVWIPSGGQDVTPPPLPALPQ